VLPATLVKSIVQASAVATISDTELENVIQRVIGENPKAVADYKKGKEQARMFLFGNVLRTLKGKGDKKLILEMLVNRIKK
jgi:aspartyl-tRNA(Asn)/glutamyl-tRNA(Gln) amidotransferase subunit B